MTSTIGVFVGVERGVVAGLVLGITLTLATASVLFAATKMRWSNRGDVGFALTTTFAVLGYAAAGSYLALNEAQRNIQSELYVGAAAVLTLRGVAVGYPRPAGAHDESQREDGRGTLSWCFLYAGAFFAFVAWIAIRVA